MFSLHLHSKPGRTFCVFLWVPHTIHGPANTENANVTLKLGPIGTIHSLKIILLQYF